MVTYLVVSGLKSLFHKFVISGAVLKYLLFLVLFVSCDYIWKGKDQLEFDTRTSIPQSININQNLDVKEILNEKCLSCHEWINDIELFVSRIDHDDIKNSAIYDLVERDQMPPGEIKLNTDEKLLLFSYLQGISFGTLSREPLPQIPVSKFEKLKTEVLDKKCVVCHSWASSENEVLKRVEKGDPDLSKIYQLAERGIMPPGPEMLNEEELEILREYILELK